MSSDYSMTKMKLTESLLKSNFEVAKIFRENTSAINSIDFTSVGDNLITGSSGDEIIIYNCREGTQKRTLHSKKYGVEMIKYTHGVSHFLNLFSSIFPFLITFFLTERKCYPFFQQTRSFYSM